MLHLVHLGKFLDCGSAVLLHDLKNLVPEEIGLLSLCVRHLDEGRGNRAARGGVLAEQTIGSLNRLFCARVPVPVMVRWVCRDFGHEKTSVGIAPLGGWFPFYTFVEYIISLSSL